MTVANEVTKDLCNAATVKLIMCNCFCVCFPFDVHLLQRVHPLEQSILVVNITAEHNLSTTVDVALLSAIIEMLTDEAMLNAMVI